MEQLRRIVLDAEDRIVHAVMDAAREHGYAHYMPSLEEAYRLAVATISANLLQVLSMVGDVADLRAGEPVSADPIAMLGGRFARMRRGDGTDLTLFLGMLKVYRRAYADVVRGSGLDGEDLAIAVRAVERYFDRLEMGYVAAWTSYSSDQVNEELVERNRRISMDKIRYLSAVGGLPLPLMLLDAQGRVENMNTAAAVLFGAPGARGGPSADAGRREAPPVLRDEIREFLASDEPAASLEREIKTGKGTRYFEAKFTKLHDSEGAYSGALIVLTDLTYRRTAEDALRRSQNKYVSLFENMVTAFAYTKVVLDRRNRPADYILVEFNEAFARTVGQPAESIVGRLLTEVMPGIEQSRHDWLGRLGKVAVTGETAAFDALAEPLGRWFSVSAYNSSPGYVTLMMSDISELKWVQESLSHSRDFYLTLFEGFPTLIWRAGADGSHDYFNTSWLEFTGRTMEQSVGSGWMDDVHPDDRDRRAAAIAAAARDRQPFALEYRLRHRSGDYRWVLDSGRPFTEVEGAFAGLIGSVQDISERKRQEQQLEHLATHDELTNLPNRRVFEEALQRSVAHARRGHPSSLLFIDVDGFKEVNDSLGHAEGDRALVGITSAVRKIIRGEDLLSRIGGDEFGALLMDTVLSDARRVAERLRVAVRDQVRGSGAGKITLSIGLVEVDGLAAADAVLSQADAAMYRAKDSGGDRVLVYQPGFEPADMSDSSTGSMLAKLKDALARDGALIFHYQPVFRVSDGTIEYFEALTRLVDREQRVIAPAQFISVAERFGLMPQFSRWVVRHAVGVLGINPDLKLSVNLSGLDVEDGVLLDDILHMLKENDVKPARLSFEMSEASVLQDIGQAREWISRARDAGFGFALDDFGSGYNSFGYLRSLPVDRVKIDGSVTRSLVADPRQLTLLEAVCAVTSISGVKTVAECVENEYVLEVVRDVGVDMAQGYHLGRPSPDLAGGGCDWTSMFPGPRRP
jgi:diguanylate cyclase (GGDEF)-like protein/PAS domain S-box-containing protein